MQSYFRWYFRLFAGIGFILSLAITSCLPPKKEKADSGEVNFSIDLEDATNRLIYNWQDRMRNDSLFSYFNHQSPSKRLIAVLALGSNPDSTAIPLLAPMLNDPDLSVKVAAAYAMGQTGHISAEKHLLDAWIDNDQTAGYAAMNQMILESVGKTGSLATLRHMVEMNKLIPTDTLLLIGQARGIFRFMLRGIVLPAGTQLMAERLEDKLMPEKVKLIASQYLARVPAKETESYQARLMEEYKKDYSVYIKANLLLTIGSHPSKAAFDLLKKVALDSVQDYRLRVQAIKGLTNQPGEETEQLMDKLLMDPDAHIQQVAGNYIIQHGSDTRAVYYYHRARQLDESDFNSKYSLMMAALKFLPPYLASQRDSMVTLIKNDLSMSSSIAISAYMIQTLAYDYNSMVFLKDLMYSDQPVAIRSAAAGALGKMAARKSFDAHFKSYAPESKTFIAKYLATAASDAGNPLLAPAAQALIDGGAGLRLYIPDTVDFKKTMDSLIFPRQAEEYGVLAQLYVLMYPDIAAIPPYKPVMSNPLDWDLFSSIPDSAIAEIQTNRGKIEVRLFKNTTPGTVCQFVRLAKEGYYDKKIFHRVEPYFVVQGGCNRGDGYGSLDEGLRSETPPTYFEEEGLIGMASVGRHTESQQFFITHGPAMHLDGKFTLFGKVVKGMEVVHQLKAGDVIESISIR
jgi:cyclophilin family peptidyl-prolyl cis-trans isomerase